MNKTLKIFRAEQTLFLVALITLIGGSIIFTLNFFETYDSFSFVALGNTALVSLSQEQTWILIIVEMILKYTLFYRLNKKKKGALLYAIPIVGICYSYSLKQKNKNHLID